jgi:hypothetical protein
VQQPACEWRGQAHESELRERLAEQIDRPVRTLCSPLRSANLVSLV